MSKDRKSLLVFYGITLALSFLVECLYISSENDLLMVLLMWIPGIVGLICSKVFYGKEGSVGIRRKVEVKYLLFGILAPVVYLVCSYCIAWAVLGDPTTGVDSHILVMFAVAFLPGLLGSALTAAGEEIGWRGFAYPVLEREFGAVRAVLINGFIWALWHVPLIVGGVYQAAVNPAYGICAFVVMILLIAWGMAVSYRHYADSEQIITFYTTVIIATCFPAVKPYAGISLIMLSFAAYFLILYGCDGAARIQPFNYFTFGVICAAGSVTRYHLTLRHLREKAESDRLNASLRQDVQDMKYEVTKKELELSRTKIRLMQDQISPHFIFNALGIIKSLIWEDPRRAADSVNDFSVYLRRNIEALKSGDMILFHKELEHIEAFLAIEKADETVDLTVEYDIREADFPIPPLTVEPLVENAVIHGVSGYEHGARLSVSSRREDDCYIIEVRDNGRGFDAVKVTKGVGIDNVRTRLEVQCGGRLEIESSARGTTAVIYIPVRGEADENPGA